GHMKALRDRYTSPGNSFNFGERLNRILRFYVSDVSEAYQKSRAVQVALKSACGIESVAHSFPGPKSTEALDDLVMWTREVIDLYERFRASDTDLELTVYVRQPDGAGRSLLDATAFDTTLKNSGEFSLDLSRYFPPETSVKFLRVKGVGM